MKRFWEIIKPTVVGVSILLLVLVALFIIFTSLALWPQYAVPLFLFLIVLSGGWMIGHTTYDD